MKRAIVFLNGELKGDKKFYHKFINPTDTIFCADGGAKYTYQLNLMPQLILGDLDSIPEDVIEFYQQSDTQFKKYPAEKNKSDTELLLETVIARDYEEIVLFAALGGRFDHALANLYLLEGLFTKKVELKIVTPNNYLLLIKGQKIIEGGSGQTVSFLPLSKRVSGVTLKGFKYELENDTLLRGQTLGLSNIIQSNSAQIEVETGSLLMVVNN